MYAVPSTVLQPRKILETHFVAARQRVRALYRAAFYSPKTFCFGFFLNVFFCAVIAYGNIVSARLR